LKFRRGEEAEMLGGRGGLLGKYANIARKIAVEIANSKYIA